MNRFSAGALSVTPFERTAPNTWQPSASFVYGPGFSLAPGQLAYDSMGRAWLLGSINNDKTLVLARFDGSWAWLTWGALPAGFDAFGPIFLAIDSADRPHVVALQANAGTSQPVQLHSITWR